MTHTITGGEAFLNRSLASVGVPDLHILRALNGQEYRFYELTGDLPEALHFRHFEQTDLPKVRRRIRLKAMPQPDDSSNRPGPGRVKLHE
jgi:hypothetical protein